jgi:hypothetical protein
MSLAAANPFKSRDPRLDAFRGIALAMIFIDHVPGNPYEHVTMRNWGFSDAAEAFFFMSGLAAGLAYSGRFRSDRLAETGLWAAMMPMWRRSRTLYFAQLIISLCVIAIFLAAAQVFAMPELLEKHNLGLLFSDPARALPGLVALTHQIGYVNILPAYVVLLLAAPFAILLGLKRPLALFVASAALWLAAGMFRLNIPNYPGGGGWFFNPFAWQFIFVIGLLTGIYYRQGKRLVKASPWLFALAVGWLALVLAWKYWPGLGAVLNKQMWHAGQLGAPYHFVTHNKTYLALPRLLHILALIYVLSCLPVVTRLCATRLAEPFRLMGRHGLEVFAVGSVLAMAFQALMDGYGDPLILGVILPPLGLLFLYGVARVNEQRKQPAASMPQPQRAVPATAR